MLNELLVGGAVAASSGVVGFLIAKRLTSSHFDLYLEQAKAKAKAKAKEAAPEDEEEPTVRKAPEAPSVPARKSVAYVVANWDDVDD